MSYSTGTSQANSRLYRSLAGAEVGTLTDILKELHAGKFAGAQVPEYNVLLNIRAGPNIFDDIMIRDAYEGGRILPQPQKFAQYPLGVDVTVNDRRRLNRDVAQFVRDAQALFAFRTYDNMMVLVREQPRWSLVARNETKDSYLVLCTSNSPAAHIPFDNLTLDRTAMPFSRQVMSTIRSQYPTAQSASTGRGDFSRMTEHRKDVLLGRQENVSREEKRR